MAAYAAKIGGMAITRRGSSGANGSESDAHRGTDRGPLPEEALDALVTVLDESGSADRDRAPSSSSAPACRGRSSPSASAS